ncbi:MAG: ABC transporter permease [Caldilinea sp.]|nr:ABC transporter permease [Caldilinea sp.]MCB0056440.1 ABC transporter permease [Caldilineaceae bacterium]MCB0040205.1 ABC transporter permease [Caldilinea sp.]MCB0051104.1 ABC transporter permease [Caldilinea sp.]MCB0067626.1 ABC transporter permease [Caldilineaceae bacterium]
MTSQASWWERLRNNSLFWPLVALALVMGFNLLFTPNFFRLEIKDGHLFGSLVDVLNRGAPLMLMAIGLTAVIATAGVDLSVGAVAAICAAVATRLVGNVTDVTATPLPLVILVTLGVAILCGLWNGLLVSRANIQPMVATLVLMVAGRGIAQLITDGQIITVYYPPFFYFGAGYLLGLPFTLFIVAAVFLFAWLITRRTAIGLFVESVGTNASSSYYSGVNEKNIKLVAYVFCSFCAGIAGIIISSNVKSADANNVGLFMELDAILAVVIGGTLMSGGRFSLAGSVLGALLIQSVTTTIYAFGVPPEVVLVVKSLVVLFVVLLYSEPMKVALDKLARRKGVQA